MGEKKPVVQSQKQSCPGKRTSVARGDEAREREREPEPDLWVLQAWEGTRLPLGKPLEGYKQEGI